MKQWVRGLRSRWWAAVESVGWPLAALALWAKHPGDRFEKHIGHHLPVTLFLATVVTALSLNTPDFMRPAVAATSAATIWVDEVVSRAFGGLLGRPESLFQQAVRAADDDSRKRGANAALPLVTVLSLTPDAHARFLGRTTPTPRLELACVLLAVHDSLERRGLSDKPGDPAPPRPVLAIDVDISTVVRADGLLTSARHATPWAPNAKDGLNTCRTGLLDLIAAAQPKPAPADSQKAKRPDLPVDDAMRAVLRKLARQAEVVAITYPRRLSAERMARDAFISKACCAPGKSGPANGCVSFASPQLTFVPGDLVFEFPNGRAADGEVQIDLPAFYPGLGQVMADARLRAAHVWAASSGPKVQPAAPGQAGTDLCVDTLHAVSDHPANDKHRRVSLDDELADPEAAERVLRAYAYNKIEFGDAMSRISIFDIRAEVNRPDKDTYRELKESLQNVDWTEVVMLNINPGSTEDQFRIPVADAPVPGAWVHAAVALTLMKRALPEFQAPTWRQKAGKFASKVAVDVLLGLVFAWMVWFAVHRIDASENPVGRQVATAVVALLASVLVQLIYLRYWSAPQLFGGEPFYPPLLVLLGLSVHIFVEALSPASGGHDAPDAAHVQSGEGSPPPPPYKAHGMSDFGKLVQENMQRLWAASLAAAAAWVLVKFPVGWPDSQRMLALAAVLAAALMFGIAYRWAAQHLHALPLPWRHP